MEMEEFVIKRQTFTVSKLGKVTRKVNNLVLEMEYVLQRGTFMTRV